MILDTSTIDSLKHYLALVESPVVFRVSLGEDVHSTRMRQMLNEIASLSGLIFIEQAQLARTPSFEVSKAGQSSGILFAGLPLGHEFTSLILAILQVSGRAPKITPQQVEQIKSLQGPLKFETYISLSCHNCPDVVQALNMLALLNPAIEHTMIDGAIFQEEINQRQVMAVPSVYLNGELFGNGRMTLEEILSKVDSASGQRQLSALNDKTLFDILIIGGGPAGASAAIYAARKGIKTGLVAQRFGGQVLDTLGIENFISISATEGPRLVQNLEQHVKNYDVDIMTNLQASRLYKEDNFTVELDNGARLQSKSVVIATGASWRQLGVAGEQEFKNKGVAYCPHCDGPLFKGKDVAVIGGGNSGVEAAIDLAGIVQHVTLLEYGDALKADQVLQRRLYSLPNVRVVLNAQTMQINGQEKVTSLEYRNRLEGTIDSVPVEGVFVQIGLVPNTAWVKGFLETNRFGEIITDASGATSVPGVYAAGDCTTVPYKQIIISMGEGAKASLGAFEYLIRH